MIVTKFGGSSMANAAQIQKACKILLADQNRKFMIVSAPGKRFDGDSKVTDLLINLAKSALSQCNCDGELQLVLDRFASIIDDFQLDDKLLHAVKADLLSRVSKTSIGAPRFMDLIKAAGEDNCAKIVAAYLQKIGVNAHYIDPWSAGMILSDEAGNARMLQSSYKNLSKLSEIDGIGIFPGFFGFTPNGDVVTFARGGSDISGSILAVATKADLYENFTDVDSVYVANPKQIDQPLPISEMTYREMRELAYAGFTVLHDESVEPVFRARIPIHIKNTNNPDAAGTLIVSERQSKDFQLSGIAGSEGFCILYVGKFLMNREIGFGRKLFQILEDEHISFDHSPSGIDEISPILRQDQLTEENTTRLIGRISSELSADVVEIRKDVALLMLVGEGMLSAQSIIARSANALARKNISILVINICSSGVSLTIGVAKNDLSSAIKALYNEFFSN